MNKNNAVRVVLGNSIKVYGTYTIVYPDGSEEEISDSKRSFCRCGFTKTMPFCDNAHRSVVTWNNLKGHHK